ncbi:MAG: B12-binding domain-containing radical SAM protein [Candidatus Bathyarchaeota archaeon]|nr:B12-binding domain-containing radical SAM protein [Candidatus Bathyarchaeota archaeon]MCZ2807729.1 radical SAM protein [Candidatus Bathyarchaeota archaeon]
MTTAPPIKAPWIVGRKLPPLGLAYVAAALEKGGFQVEVLDNYLLKKPIDYVKLEIERLSPEIVGITCGSVTYQRCVETAKAVKEVLPSCKVVVGGPHPSYMPDSMLQHPEIDYVVLGEGERAIVELATKITEDEDNRAIATIPGVACRCEGKITKTAPRFISDLDQIPYPARHLLPMHLYNRTIEYLSVNPVDTMNVVRGCPYNCAFCETKDLWGRTCRAFSPSRVVEEIEHLTNQHGSKGIYFVGDNFTIQKKNTIETCKLIKKQRLDIEWVCDTRVDLISRELLENMREAGCRTITFGVESGSPHILEKLNKGTTLEQAVHAFKLCKEEGIQIACSFMLGIPGETINDMKATYDFAKKLDPDWCQFNIFVAYPFSRLYEEILQKGLYDRVEDFVLYVKTEDFNFESLLKVQRRFHMSFNRSPKRILRRIRREGFLNVLRKNL